MEGFDENVCEGRLDAVLVDVDFTRTAWTMVSVDVSFRDITLVCCARMGLISCAEERNTIEAERRMLEIFIVKRWKTMLVRRMRVVVVLIRSRPTDLPRFF